MRSRTVREGSVGLLILSGLALFVGVALWLRGLNPANRSFRILIEFANSAGLQEGAPVRFRGVAVGKVVEIKPMPNRVEVIAQISPADIIIPRDVVAQANQSGLISQSTIDLTPTRVLAQPISTRPLDSDCDTRLILCNNARLKGEPGASIDELIRASVQFANTYTNPAFFTNVNSVVKNTSEAAAEIAKLSKEFNLLTQDAREELKTFSASAAVISRTADKFGVTAEKIGITADQVNELIASNQTTLVSTLNNLEQASTQLQGTIGNFGGVINRVDRSQILRNLEILTANAARASASLRATSDALNNPANVLILQQTLDSARSTFQNAQKITADLDELTGDPAFRTNLRNLVNGLSGLVSSTQQLQQQTQTAQMLAPIAASLKRSNSTEMMVIPVPAKSEEGQGAGEGNSSGSVQTEFKGE